MGYTMSSSLNSTVDSTLSVKRVFAINQVLLGWKTWMIIIMKPTNTPTQGQPNPRKIWFKVEFGPLFPTAKHFFVGWD